MRETEALKQIARGLRRDIVEMIYRAGSGHPGGSLSIADLITALYFDEMNQSSDRAGDPARDRFVLSKGHTAPALYAALAKAGYFDREELWKLRQVGAMLQGHPDRKGTPGVDAPPVRWGLAFRPPAEWRKPQSSMATPIGSMPFWATASWRRDRSGRPFCSPPTISSTICA